MSINYAYQYARVRETDGLCIGAEDTTTYILNRIHVPIDDADGPYLLKYYWPLPEAPVTSHDDFKGKWYIDAAHTQEATELNG